MLTPLPPNTRPLLQRPRSPLRTIPPLTIPTPHRLPRRKLRIPRNRTDHTLQSRELVRGKVFIDQGAVLRLCDEAAVAVGVQRDGEDFLDSTVLGAGEFDEIREGFVVCEIPDRGVFLGYQEEG